ncbi:fumarylacetoacetase [Lewinella marina]|uniref:fumarylacetoacetase n=1 Tax=Neolewinella marina TaxID=438751 RepID=A0A2G0CCM5_9BACT|nr:fumarylacetoacetase [Neolewinella marina]NJB87581.1 fumarylacetoacetase [Neolewinella marina]PHK97728.1 fumarylacetoacetase [Neolewinella marina]
MSDWLRIPPDSDFTLANLPYGIFSTDDRPPRAGVAVGEQILDLAELGNTGVFDFDVSVLNQPTLNAFVALGKSVTSRARTRVQSWLRMAPDGPIQRHHLVPMAEATLHLPVRIGDYTDFYSSIEHATNVGRMFRDPEKALLPNWRHLPVGYHGRASSIVVSGTPVRRPVGQLMPAEANHPVFEPTRRLDFELEMAFVVGKDSELGRPISVDEAEDYIFGMLLFNDWSARDIQRWEYVPLGPFLGKSFASSVSPWLVPLEALGPFRVAGPEQTPGVLPYLQSTGKNNYDIDLEVKVNEETVCRSNFRYMYWNMQQQLAHHTSNGCNVRVGDLMASGTISGQSPDSYGSLLELTDNGTRGGFLRDGDTVTMTGHAGQGAERVGFGSVTGRILPARR